MQLLLSYRHNTFCIQSKQLFSYCYPIEIIHCVYNLNNYVAIAILIIIIMLAYFYCAAYTRMTKDESSPPCVQRCITFNDDEQRVQLARPELPAPHYIWMHRRLPTTPHHRLGIITPDLLPIPIYRPRKDGQLGQLRQTVRTQPFAQSYYTIQRLQKMNQVVGSKSNSIPVNQPRCTLQADY